MKERPIIFNGEMVRAILDGRKTQTRRVVKHRITEPDSNSQAAIYDWYDPVSDKWVGAHWKGKFDVSDARHLCPYGQPGDGLWVRESHYLKQDGGGVAYAADNAPLPPGAHVDGFSKLRPSIHMPRWASRITIEITDIRVEQVQEISNADVMREGAPICSHQSCTITGPPKGCDMQLCGFRQLWDSINAKRGYGWDVNPWVWVVEFQRVEP